MLPLPRTVTLGCHIPPSIRTFLSHSERYIVHTSFCLLHCITSSVSLPKVVFVPTIHIGELNNKAGKRISIGSNAVGRSIAHFCRVATISKSHLACHIGDQHRRNKCRSELERSRLNAARHTSRIYSALHCDDSW